LIPAQTPAAIAQQEGHLRQDRYPAAAADLRGKSIHLSYRRSAKDGQQGESEGEGTVQHFALLYDRIGRTAIGREAEKQGSNVKGTAAFFRGAYGARRQACLFRSVCISSPVAFDEFIVEYTEKRTGVIREAGIKAE
jgi:hypothetical protein